MTRGGTRFRGILWGGVLLAAGTWFLLQRLGLHLPNFFSALWPIFPFMFGTAFLVTFFTAESRDKGLVWPGTFGVLLGSFFFLFTLGVFEWSELGRLWGVFPLIVGISFLATWVGGGFKETGLLVPAVITMGVGGFGLGFELGTLDAHTIKLVWPLALVLLGASMVARSLRRPRPRAPDLSAESSRRDE